MQEFGRSSSPEILKLFLAKENMLKQNVSEKPNRQNSRSRAAPGGLEGAGGGSERALPAAQMGHHPLTFRSTAGGPKLFSHRAKGTHLNRICAPHPVSPPHQGATLPSLN